MNRSRVAFLRGGSKAKLSFGAVDNEQQPPLQEALLAMSRRQADVATPRRRGHASTQTSDSALEELVTLKRAVAAQGAELERLRAELPKLQEQSERTVVAESSASLAAQRDEQHSSRMRHLHRAHQTALEHAR